MIIGMALAWATLAIAREWELQDAPIMAVTPAENRPFSRYFRPDGGALIVRIPAARSAAPRSPPFLFAASTPLTHAHDQCPVSAGGSAAEGENRGDLDPVPPHCAGQNQDGCRKHCQYDPQTTRRVTAFGMTTHRNAHLGKGEPVPGQRMPIVFVPVRGGIPPSFFFQMRFPLQQHVQQSTFLGCVRRATLRRQIRRQQCPQKQCNQI